MNAFHRLHTLRMANDAADYAMQEMKPRFDRLANRHETGAAPRAVVAYQLFQTPPDLARKLAGLLTFKAEMRLLEPSSGLGRLLDAAQAVSPHPLQFTAIEHATPCAEELYRQQRANVRLLQRDFLTVTPADTGGLFDAVLMNPPFHLRDDIRHIRHALTFLKPGGQLAALCLATKHRCDALQSLADHWEEIPAGTFRQEGTPVATYLLRITKT